MKLDELERRGLEIIYLKLQLLQNEVNRLNQEYARLNNERTGVLKKFADANLLDVDRLSVDIASGEATLIEIPEKKAEV